MRGTGPKMSKNVAQMLQTFCFLFPVALTTFSLCVGNFLVKTVLFLIIAGKKTKRGGDKRGRPGAPPHWSWIPPTPGSSGRQNNRQPSRGESAMRLFWQIIVLSAVLLEAGESDLSTSSSFLFYSIWRFLNERQECPVSPSWPSWKRRKNAEIMNGMTARDFMENV